jgi:hypothetical protein
LFFKVLLKILSGSFNLLILNDLRQSNCSVIYYGAFIGRETRDVCGLGGRE